MIPAKFSTVINDKCDVNIKMDTRNTFSYDKWKANISNYKETIMAPQKDEGSGETWVDGFKFNINYTDGTDMEVEPKLLPERFNDKTILFMTEQIKYKFTKGVYGFNHQIPMIKLFMAVHMSRKHVKYCRLNDGAIKFTFKMFDAESESYSEVVELCVDNRILVDSQGLPVVIESNSMLDHLLLKAFIKLSNIMKINIKDINVNSLVAMCRGGYLYKINLSKNVDVSSLDFTIDDLLDNTNQDMIQKINQCSWVSDNIIRAISGEDTVPYNCYAEMIHNLHKQGTLLGITIGNSFMYIIDRLVVGECGGLSIFFHNIFNCKEIEVSIQNVIHGMNQIGVITDKKNFAIKQ